MITVRRATKEDLPAIRELRSKYTKGMADLTPAHFNKKDIALQARDDNGKLVGFTWIGLMAGSTLGYSDHTIVDPAYLKQGVTKLLFSEVTKIAKQRGCKQCFAITRRDEFHNSIVFGADKLSKAADLGMYAAIEPYTFISLVTKE